MNVKTWVSILLFLFVPPLSMVAGEEPTVAVDAYGSKFDRYVEHVYRHENSYVKNMGYPGWYRISKKQAENIVWAAAMSATKVWTMEDILAQLERESHYMLKAHSYAGAIGVSQVMDHLWRGWSVDYETIVQTKSKLYDPYVAVSAQVMILETFYASCKKNKACTHARYSGGAIDYHRDIKKIKIKLQYL